MIAKEVLEWPPRKKGPEPPRRIRLEKTSYVGGEQMRRISEGF